MKSGLVTVCPRKYPGGKSIVSFLLVFSLVFGPAGAGLTADGTLVGSNGSRAGSTSAAQAVQTAKTGTLWSVQAGSFQIETNAVAFARTLRAKGVAQAAIVRLFDSKDRLWHVVEAGVFTSRRAAEAEARSLRERLSLSTMVKSMAAALHAERVVTPDLALSVPLPALPSESSEGLSLQSASKSASDFPAEFPSESRAGSRPESRSESRSDSAAESVIPPVIPTAVSPLAQSPSVVASEHRSTELPAFSSEQSSAAPSGQLAKPAPVLSPEKTPEQSPEQSLEQLPNRPEAQAVAPAQGNKTVAAAPQSTPDIEEGAGQAENSAEQTVAATPQEQQGSQMQTVTATAPTNEDYTPFTADAKQAQLIVARTMFRQGQYDDALKMYDALMLQYPDDPIVWEHYTDTLIEARSWEQADTLLARWRMAMPDNRQAVAQTARFYVTLAAETGEYHLSYPWFEDLLRENPQDTGAMTDYAFARQAAGDWATALELFGRVSEQDSENDDTRRAMQTILRDRVPRLEVNFRSEVRTGDTSLNTWNTVLSAQASHRLRLEGLYDYTCLDRRSNAQDGTPSVAREAHHRRVRGTYQLNEDWALIAGVGQYAGTAEGVSVEGGADWQIHQPGVVRLRFASGMPWVNTVDAADREGTEDSIQLEYDGFFNDRWGLRFLAGLGRYSLGSRQYALQEREEAGLFYRLTAVPDWSVGYSFTRTRLYYRDSEPPARPVDLVEKEDIHGVRTDILQWYNDYIALRAFGSASIDVFRKSPLWSSGAGVRVRTGERMEVDLGVEYNSDSGQVGGGESKAVTGSVLFRF